MTHDIDQIAATLAAGLTIDQMREKQNALAAGRRYIHDEGDEARARLRAYAAEVNAPRRENALVVVRSTRPEKIAYEAARKAVWKILCERGEQLNRAFTFTDEQKPVIANLVRYFINDPECKYDLSDGLFLYGLPGCGKTEIMMAFSKFTFQYKLTKYFQLVSLSKVYTDAKEDKEYHPVSLNVQQDKCFDELGVYTGPVVRFGDSLDINQAIIEQRNERKMRYGLITHFIANAAPNQLKDVLTPMLFDRVRGMATGVYFSSESKR